MGYSIVVVGCSLGGLRALQTVLADLPADFPGTVVIVQHREAGSDETLVELLRQHSRLPVGEPEDKDPILPGRVYLAPPDYHLLIETTKRPPDHPTTRLPDHPTMRLPGHFALSTDEPVNYARPSIDVLFESAADAYGERVIGVILTGANADGAQGLAAIKRRGGLTIVQDPATAEAPAMPEAAIAAAQVDAVLPLQEIGLFLKNAAVR